MNFAKTSLLKRQMVRFHRELMKNVNDIITDPSEALYFEMNFV